MTRLGLTFFAEVQFQSSPPRTPESEAGSKGSDSWSLTAIGYFLLQRMDGPHIWLPGHLY